ncbi:acyl-CoA dehydrogenase family protein [Bradyrhizobium liaoningense]|uniref:acyl-CoA dehydrogenase family protein n=1 Tax=Bradyrhizobium liaoningense TaxID=43992 RepID=UPI001BA8B66A|nr:acyl-CoA dehydrogenase family protein [Bradyrhizobium liaoningense]MBR0840382.1 acyl-CoA dehydrogenase family protein [Bradyrhizobium liaoningense]
MSVFEQLERGRTWDENEALILAQVDRLCAEIIAPNAARIDETGEFPWDNIRAINELGLNTIFIPEQFGGAGMSFRLYLAVMKRISEACAATGIIFGTNFHAMKPLVEFGTDEQRERLLPCIAEGGLASLAITEEAAGSDATGMKTRFTVDGDDIVIDGAKIFITSGDVADRILLFGKFAGIEDSKKAISVLVLEKGAPGFEVVRLENKMGHRGSSTAALRLDGVRVPKANLIGSPGDGLRILLASLNRSRPSIAAHALGIAMAAFKDMTAYMNERKQSGRRIVDFQGNQFLLADLATDLAMADCWLDYLANLIDGGAKDFGVEASMAKMRASDLAMRAATDAVQMHGGYGYCRDLRVERLMRDAKITQIWEGTNQVHRQLIGRSFATK